MNDDRLQLLTDHAAIADALHRYAAVLDHGDADLLARH